MSTRRLDPHHVAAAAALLLTASAGIAQCTLVIQDTFRLGLRPHGGSGSLRQTILGETLSGFWPLVPTNVQWTAPSQSGAPTWIWSATSLDPMEVDPQDPSNGTAFGYAHAAALLPFTAPAGQAPFKLSLDTVLGIGQPNPVYYGFTSSSAVNDNFLANGSLWMSLDGLGNWTVYANSTPVATGNAPYGQFGTGWMRLDLTYDPAASTAAGHIGEIVFGPVPVSITRSLAFVGFEAHDGPFNDVNNFVVVTGTPVSIAVPPPPPAPPGSNAVITAQSNAVAPMRVFWRRDGFLLTDGPSGTGSTISGSSTLSLSINNVSQGDAGSYDCTVANPCGLSGTAAATFVVGSAPCYANCDNSTTAPVLNVLDFSCFLNRFAAGDTYANCDHSTIAPVLNVLDFSCFLNQFAVGCP